MHSFTIALISTLSLGVHAASIGDSVSQQVTREQHNRLFHNPDFTSANLPAPESFERAEKISPRLFSSLGSAAAAVSGLITNVAITNTRPNTATVPHAQTVDAVVIAQDAGVNTQAAASSQDAVNLQVALQAAINAAFNLQVAANSQDAINLQAALQAAINVAINLQAAVTSQDAINLQAALQVAIDAAVSLQAAANSQDAINLQAALQAAINLAINLQLAANSQDAINLQVALQVAVNAAINLQVAANSQDAINLQAALQAAINAAINLQAALQAAVNAAVNAGLVFSGNTANVGAQHQDAVKRQLQAPALPVTFPIPLTQTANNTGLAAREDNTKIFGDQVEEMDFSAHDSEADELE